jgi:hypothetical protein
MIKTPSLTLAGKGSRLAQETELQCVDGVRIVLTVSRPGHRENQDQDAPGTTIATAPISYHPVGRPAW